MQEETKQVKTKNNFLKNALSIVLLIVVSALVVFLFIKDDMDGLLVALKQTKWIFILYAFGLMMVAYILDGLCLMILILPKTFTNQPINLLITLEYDKRIGPITLITVKIKPNIIRIVKLTLIPKSSTVGISLTASS